MEIQSNIEDDLYTSKNVKTAQDLKGKAIAISSFGATTYGEALIAIKTLGLSPSDVTITQIGDDAARRAALASGAVAGSMNDKSENPSMLKAGFNDLLMGTQMKSGLPTESLVVTKAYAQQHPNTVLDMIAAYTDALNVFRTNPQDAIAAAVKFEKTDVATATNDVTYDHAGYAPWNGKMTLLDYQNAQTLFAKTEAKLASVDVTQILDSQFTDQLQSLGWYTAMGITP
jgi:ABC-type nitrate/sulfonate/bicarbonate transport system substrate-binding protein